MIFLGAATYKFFNFLEYSRSASGLVPSFAPLRVARVLIPVLPILEAATCLLLFVPRWRRHGAALALTLLAIFTLFLAGSYSQGTIVLGCSCSGLFLKFLTPERLSLMLIRNAILRLVAGYVAQAARTGRGTPPACNP